MNFLHCCLKLMPLSSEYWNILYTIIHIYVSTVKLLDSNKFFRDGGKEIIKDDRCCAEWHVTV